MNTSIKLFRIQSRSSSTATRQERQLLYVGGAPAYPSHMHNNSSTYTHYNPKYDYVISAVLTQEMSAGGHLEIALRNNIRTDVDDTRNFIEVTSPFILCSGHGSLSDMQNTGCKWIGRQARKTYKSDRVVLSYDGELSWLESRIIKPYTNTGTNINFTAFVVGLYNNQYMVGTTSDSWTSYYPWDTRYTTASHSLCDIGPSVTRSNIYLSTMWHEIKEKTLDRYSNQINMQGITTSTNSDYRRALLIKPISSTDRGVIDEKDIISASHTLNLADRHVKIYAYGEHNSSGDGDGDRWQGSAQSTSDYTSVNFSTNKAYVIGDYTSTETLNTKAAGFAATELSDTDTIDLMVTPSKQEELNLGELYHIKHLASGIDGYYRLQKRQVDLLNPAKTKLTFGNHRTISSVGRYS